MQHQKPTKEQNDKARALIVGAMGTTAAAGFVDPTPGGFDVPIIIAAWAGMLGGMASIYKIPFDKNAVIQTITSALASTGLFMAGTKALTTALKWSGVGWVAGGGVNAFLNAVFTWRVGILYQNAFHNGCAQPTAKDVFDSLKGAMSFSEVWSVLKKI